MASPSPRSGHPNLSVETESLVSFKQRVDGLLAYLDKGSPGQISDQTIARASYGDSFSAADAIHHAYETFHDRLKTLSQLLGDQINATGLTADVVCRGYQNVDQNQQAQLLAIEARLRQQGQPPTSAQPAVSTASPTSQAAPAVTTTNGF